MWFKPIPLDPPDGFPIPLFLPHPPVTSNLVLANQKVVALNSLQSLPSIIFIFRTPFICGTSRHISSHPILLLPTKPPFLSTTANHQKHRFACLCLACSTLPQAQSYEYPRLLQSPVVYLDARLIGQTLFDRAPCPAPSGRPSSLYRLRGSEPTGSFVAVCSSHTRTVYRLRLREPSAPSQWLQSPRLTSTTSPAGRRRHTARITSRSRTASRC